jgi:hypothetical protein
MTSGSSMLAITFSRAVKRDGDRAVRGFAAGFREGVVDPRARLVIHCLAREQRETGTGLKIDRETGCRGSRGLRV